MSHDARIAALELALQLARDEIGCIEWADVTDGELHWMDHYSVPGAEAELMSRDNVGDRDDAARQALEESR